jgi:hypothetical protein
VSSSIGCNCRVAVVLIKIKKLLFCNIGCFLVLTGGVSLFHWKQARMHI